MTLRFMLLPRSNSCYPVGNGGRVRETVPSASKTATADSVGLGDNATHENRSFGERQLSSWADQAVYTASNLLHLVHQAWFDGRTCEVVLEAPRAQNGGCGWTARTACSRCLSSQSGYMRLPPANMSLCNGPGRCRSCHSWARPEEEGKSSICGHRDSVRVVSPGPQIVSV
jgi:hypothetical protein